MRLLSVQLFFLLSIFVSRECELATSPVHDSDDFSRDGFSEMTCVMGSCGSPALMLGMRLASSLLGV